MAIDLPFRRRAVWLSLSTAQSLQMDVWETAWGPAVR